MHYLLKELAPPVLNTLRWFSFKYGWKGNFKSFDEAKERCTGYDESHILNRIVETTGKVRDGEAVYERDGIIYDEVQVNHILLSILLLVAGRNGNKLTLIDFGGSLGTSYYQCIKYLSHLVELNWCIIEQANYVEVGKKSFENAHVKFYYTIEECIADGKTPDILLISSTLQYIKEPYNLLNHLQSVNIPYLMLDLVGYNDTEDDRITIQKVPPVFYGIEASYPCIFFGKDKLKNQIKKNYELEFDFISESQKYYINFKPFRYQGSFWKLK
ncbi:methyltransferase, TIGR04325 family [Pedobacter rhodius]|uniref:Methyltransferase, TIGR04325 family n=1 Tax=Pedobacter rhodius TaxID=3004098 RepID=A0ABT4KVP3_9SPHI|nr:methyltransferase, TIGR04325 family [Pedobacter sp. SJ11]MCZ4222987.1 methyltransferase, TIGR04325 family [Pedobacter sp. SJ11]